MCAQMGIVEATRADVVLKLEAARLVSESTPDLGNSPTISANSYFGFFLNNIKASLVQVRRYARLLFESKGFFIIHMIIISSKRKASNK